ncbi:hypothetical protein QGN29_02585 [Temperatibacter marinus]|uniref:Porin n=1 Tax=Temperatibacter marinus TaxID=1456591 RepID=A0AA52EEJ1_9PROT|nr:outer membrane beta-barrel protein [Temperatibacter marinus]WND03255.1 hypothetical protein QGN29_02585 [Temperatibacter marinus]
MIRNSHILSSVIAASLCSLSNYAVTSVHAADEKAIDVDFKIFGDVRTYGVSGERSWFDKWLGKSRYGEKRDRTSSTDLTLAELSLLAQAKIGWDWSAFIHASYAPEYEQDLDLVEGFIAYKPAPKGLWSYEGRLGLMFPHISRENDGVAWTTPYSITPSAINSWVGEEIRTMGLEGTIKRRFETFDLSFTASLFGMNDTAGTLLHFRGWALGDFKAGAFSNVPLPKIPAIYGISDSSGNEIEPPLFGMQARYSNPILELDDNIGFYAALDWTDRQGLSFGAYYYDNKGDPTVVEEGQYGWRTRFVNLYADYETETEWTFISQYMLGTTVMGISPTHPDMFPADSKYQSAFILASKAIDQWRFTSRFDWFKVTDRSYVLQDNNNEDGWSYTGAVSYTLSDNFTLIGEWLHIQNERPDRLRINLPLKTKVNQLQLSLRFQF